MQLQDVVCSICEPNYALYMNWSYQVGVAFYNTSYIFIMLLTPWLNPANPVIYLPLASHCLPLRTFSALPDMRVCDLPYSSWTRLDKAALNHLILPRLSFGTLLLCTTALPLLHLNRNDTKKNISESLCIV